LQRHSPRTSRRAIRSIDQREIRPAPGGRPTDEAVRRMRHGEVLMKKVKPNGFTVPEIMMVFTVIGILAGIAFWTVDVAEMRLDAATREMGFTLLAAQNKAVLRQYDVVVRFDAQHGRLR